MKRKERKKTSGGLRTHVKEDDGGLSFIHLYLFFCVLLLFVRRSEGNLQARLEANQREYTGY